MQSPREAPLSKAETVFLVVLGICVGCGISAGLGYQSATAELALFVCVLGIGSIVFDFALDVRLNDEAEFLLLSGATLVGIGLGSLIGVLSTVS